MSNILFNIKNLSFSISNKEILKSLSLKIYKGDYLSIIGPNGGGKTTLIKCLIKINKSPQNKIFFNEVAIEKISQKELASQISYVPQITENVFPFTAKEFLMLARYPHLSRFSSITTKDKNAVEEAFNITKTKYLSNRFINTLSGGEKQMIFIAAAFAQGGDIMLLDEPATFLDPKHEHDVYKILNRIHTQTNKTIVTVTHNINSAILNSKKIVLIKNGKVEFYGESQKILENNVLEKAYNKKFNFIKYPGSDKQIIIPEII